MPFKKFILIIGIFLFIITVVAAMYVFQSMGFISSTLPTNLPFNVPLISNSSKASNPLDEMPFYRSETQDEIAYEIKGTLSKEFSGNSILEAEMTITGDKNTKPIRFTIGGTNSKTLFGITENKTTNYSQTDNQEIAKKLKVGDSIIIRVRTDKNELRSATNPNNLTPKQQHNFQQKQFINLIETLVTEGTQKLDSGELIVVDDLVSIKR